MGVLRAMSCCCRMATPAHYETMETEADESRAVHQVGAQYSSETSWQQTSTTAY
jgi:hypothetical protein